MKNEIQIKKCIKPDEGWNIAESKVFHPHSSGKRNRKKYFVNIFNRKLRKYFNNLIKQEIK